MYGMYTSKLTVTGFRIPGACNVVGKAMFSNYDLIPKSNSLLSPNVSIDTLPPTIVNVYTGKPAGSYTAGDVLSIIVEFSKEVSFSELPSKYSAFYQAANNSYKLPFGLPSLELNSLAVTVLEGYEGTGKDRRKLSFLYLVSTGEFTPDGGQLEVADGMTIQLNGATIVGLATGVEADLTTMPKPGTVGSLSSNFSNKITITKTGEKFPPLGYDPNAAPGSTSSTTANATRRNGQIAHTRRDAAAGPIVVSVSMQLNSIFNVNEKSQSLSADFTLQTSWNDARFADPTKPAVRAVCAACCATFSWPVVVQIFLCGGFA